MNQALTAVASGTDPDAKTVSPRLSIVLVKSPNCSWAVNPTGKMTVAELPGAPGLPNAETGKETMSWPM